MPKFTYIVKDKAGKAYKNVIEAPSQQAVVEKLQKQNLFIVSVQQIAQSAPSPQRKQVNIKKKVKKFARKKVKLIDLLTFGRQLATMLEAGVTLTRSLGVIQTNVQSQQFSEILTQVKADIEQGTALSAAIAKHPKVFNQFWVSLIEVGEASGTIPVVLHKLAFYLEQQASFRSTIISGIIYPAILFGVSVGAVAFFALFVGPRFEKIFEQMGADLPTITIVLLALFSFIKNKIILIILACGALVYGFKKYISTYKGRLNWEKFLFGLPQFGEVFRNIVVERFTSQMSILIDAGVPILYALDISERLVDNNTCALIIADIKEAVRKGELLVDPMERSEFFPPMCIQMIMVGEETGELSNMLKHVAHFYLDLVETFMKRFATVVEPFMLVFMGGIIGTIVLAMFLPMFNLSSAGGGM